MVFSKTGAVRFQKYSVAEVLALARVDGDRAVRGDRRPGREREAPQAGVAHVPAVERERVDGVVVADPDALAVDVVAVVAVRVPLGVEADRAPSLGPMPQASGSKRPAAGGCRLLGRRL